MHASVCQCDAALPAAVSSVRFRSYTYIAGSCPPGTCLCRPVGSWLRPASPPPRARAPPLLPLRRRAGASRPRSSSCPCGHRRRSSSWRLRRSKKFTAEARGLKNARLLLHDRCRAQRGAARATPQQRSRRACQRYGGSWVHPRLRRRELEATRPRLPRTSRSRCTPRQRRGTGPRRTCHGVRFCRPGGARRGGSCPLLIGRPPWRCVCARVRLPCDSLRRGRWLV